MSYSYTPTYYSSLHDSITSICKNILPFSFKKRRLPAIAAAEKLRSKQQSDNLKWQQESFHQILNLMGLCKEGILHENEVSAFRSHLLETLIASPIDYELPLILRDKLIFLQELLYSKCISEDEYHASKRPLLQRLAVQGEEIGETDVIVATQTKIPSEEKCWVNTEPKNKTREGSTPKKLKGASSVFSFVSPDRYGKLKEDKDTSDSVNRNTRPKERILSNELLSSTENPFWIEKEIEPKSVLMMESLPEVESKKGERKPFKALFQKEGRDDPPVDNKENVKTMKKTSWGFDGFKKWKKNKPEDETAPLSSLTEKSDDPSYVESKTKMPSPADLFVDEAFGENVKKELCRIQTELDARSTRVNLSDDQIEDRIEERKNCGGTTAKLEKQNSKRWTTFEDEENSHPNLFAPQDSMKQARFSYSRTARTSFNSSSIDKGFKYNPFFDV